MEPGTRRRIDGLWARRLGTPVPGVSRVAVGSSGSETAGVLVVRLDDGIWVDAPVAALDPLVWHVRTAPDAALVSPRWWRELDGLDVRAVRGPCTLFWADAATPLPPGGAEVVAAGEVAELTASDTEAVVAAFGVRREGRVVAAGVVRPALGHRCEVAVAVAPPWRGHGLGRVVASDAVRWAVARAGLALWRADTDAAKLLARGLGLSEYGASLSAELASARSEVRPL